MITQSIELDCPPGPIRPWMLIEDVCEGVPLLADVTGEPVTCTFGHSEWTFNIPRDVWEADIQPVIIPRITALYEAGRIRYGSW